MYSGALTTTVTTEGCLHTVYARTRPSSISSLRRTISPLKQRSGLLRSALRQEHSSAPTWLVRAANTTRTASRAKPAGVTTGLPAKVSRRAASAAVSIMRRSIHAILALLVVTPSTRKSKFRTMTQTILYCPSNGTHFRPHRSI
jgi:hypothetical protein